MSPFHKGQKGFTLTEASLVLGIVGLILGAVWGAVGAVNETYRVDLAIKDFAIVSNAITALGPQIGSIQTVARYNHSEDCGFISQAGNAWSFYTADLTCALLAADIFPKDMVMNYNGKRIVVNPWTNIIGGQPNSVVITVGRYVPAAGYTYPPGGVIANGKVIADPNNPSASASVDAYEIAFQGLPVDACMRLVIGLTGENRDPRIQTVFVNTWGDSGKIQTFPVDSSVAANLCVQPNMFGGSDVVNGSYGTGALYEGSTSIDIVYKF